MKHGPIIPATPLFHPQSPKKPKKMKKHLVLFASVMFMAACSTTPEAVAPKEQPAPTPKPVVQTMYVRLNIVAKDGTQRFTDTLTIAPRAASGKVATTGVTTRCGFYDEMIFFHAGDTNMVVEKLDTRGHVIRIKTHPTYQSGNRDYIWQVNGACHMFQRYADGSWLVAKEQNGNWPAPPRGLGIGKKFYAYFADKFVGVSTVNGTRNADNSVNVKFDISQANLIETVDVETSFNKNEWVSAKQFTASEVSNQTQITYTIK